MIAAALALPLGCTVGPHYHAPAPPDVAAYTPEAQLRETASSTGPAGTAQRFNSALDIPAQWWTLFRSPELDGMVREALANSPTLAQATARLKEAQEELNARTGTTKYPSVTGAASVEEEQINLAAYGIRFPNTPPFTSLTSPSPFALLNGSVAVSYALDIFGANRRLIEALRAERDYQAWQLEGARLMLAGNVVSAAIRQAELGREVDITQRMIALEESELKIVEQRYAAGGVSDYDLRSARTLLAQTRAALPPLRQQLESVCDQIAVLMGKPPAEAHIAVLSLDSLHLPAELPLSVPSSLVRQRPDIRAAESLLHQASANVGVATANLYPQIVLSGSGGGVGTSFVSGGGIWNTGTSLTEPIYNGGALRAKKRKAQAAYLEAAGVYRQTVLQGFEEVADSLYAIEHDAQTLRARGDAATEAEAGYQIAQQRYGAGGISQTSVLDAQRQLLQTALDQTAAAAARYSDSTTLFEALGGGWWNNAPANPTATKSTGGLH
ncbi:MAG TPA: efflux transporter outer membrane subunit [Acidobacteriaceae bacterium]|jgi:NodT family efflux transporter outer membrane factor (OMF) lipoprotein|nr:efflux transporter outer membrane subunit [Acidobacteriaceae bacterium]